MPVKDAPLKGLEQCNAKPGHEAYMKSDSPTNMIVMAYQEDNDKSYHGVVQPHWVGPEEMVLLWRLREFHLHQAAKNS